ncbi:MAG: hypothetical protein ACI8QS_000466 [Planctomycetota bacterium]|jgi:hypothetical protein
MVIHYDALLSSFIQIFMRGKKAKARALRMSMLAGIAGYIAVYGSIHWLSRHDSGDPHQVVGELWMSSVLISFCASLLGLVIVYLNRKSCPIVARNWAPIAVGGSYVIGLLISVVTLRST